MTQYNLKGAASTPLSYIHVITVADETGTETRLQFTADDDGINYDSLMISPSGDTPSDELYDFVVDQLVVAKNGAYVIARAVVTR